MYYSKEIISLDEPCDDTSYLKGRPGYPCGGVLESCATSGPFRDILEDVPSWPAESPIEKELNALLLDLQQAESTLYRAVNGVLAPTGETALLAIGARLDSAYALVFQARQSALRVRGQLALIVANRAKGLS
jgi:hypothetical protein